MTLEEQLVRHEGLRLQIYYDTVGVPTIGVGRNLSVGISQEEALYLLRNDITRVQQELQRKLSFYADLSPIRRQVLENMAFNLGMRGLLGFTKTLTLIKQGAYAEAAQQMLMSKWARQVGKRAQRLAYMMRHDTDPPE